MPPDHAPPQQVGESRQQRQRGHLAQRTGHVAQQQLLHAHHIGRRTVLDGRQRRRTRQRVERPVHGHRERSHLHGIGDQEKDTPHQRRIEGILAQPAEGHLADGDGHESADHHDPPGNRGREVEGQQHAGHRGRPVGDRQRAADQKALDQVLERHARRHREGHDAQHVHAEDHRRNDQRGHQRHDDVAHDRGGRLRGLHVRRRSYDKFISHRLSVFFRYHFLAAAARARISPMTVCLPRRTQSSRGR